MDAHLRSGLGNPVGQGTSYELLSANEETALATLIQSGGTLDARWTAGELSRDEYTRLQFEVAAARERMVRCNLGLVHRLARRYRNRGALLEDLINEGYLALVEAVDRFDPTKGLRFSTFAVHWISPAIHHVLREAALTLHIPAYLFEEIPRMQLAQQELERRFNHPPSVEDLARFMRLTVRRVELIILASWARARAADPRDNGDAESVIESLPDNRTAVPGEHASSENEVELVLRVLPRLTGRESQILQMHFGLGDRNGRTMTLREIGTELGLSHERVRQVEKNARAKLKRYMGEHL